MLRNIDDLHKRLRTDPITHLGRKGVRLINAYEFGYELARQCHRLRQLTQTLDFGSFQEWAQARFGWTSEQGCRQNVEGFALLLTTDDASAFDFYFELRAAAKADGVGPTTVEQKYVPPNETLVAWLCSDHLRSRPGLYFGRRCLDALWAMCSGYLWAERDAGVGESDDARAMNEFQKWVEARFPFAAGCPWNRIFDFLCLGQADRSWAAMFEAFDAYRAGDASDAISNTGRKMLAAITRQVMAKNPGATFDEVADTFEKAVKRIVPT